MGLFANAYQGKTERNLNRSRMRKLREKRHIEGRGSRSWRLVARSGDGRSPAKSLYVQKNMKYPQSREFKSPRTDLITVYVSHLPRLQFCRRLRPPQARARTTATAFWMPFWDISGSAFRMW